jgi:GTP-binding protein YchF
MALQCGIIGLANVGKTTLFNCMAKNRAETSAFAFSSSKSNIGIIDVPDDRLYEIAKLVNPAKITHATVEMVDIPGLTKGSSTGEGVGNKFLADIRTCDALIHVLRCFDSDKLPHIEGSVNPVRDLETVEFELQIKDLESIDKKLQKVDKAMRLANDKEAKKAFEVLSLYKAHIESLKPARSLPVSEDDKKYIADLFLLSAKPVLYVCNVDDASAAKGNHYVDKVKDALKEENATVLTMAAEMESEIAEFENAEDRKAFLADLGLNQPGVNVLVRAAYDLLNLMSFFTEGEDEVRAWTIRKGIFAPQAARAIHTDLERGFIRAEVMKYNDFIHLKSEAACKAAGKFNVEGKNYIVQEGDIMHIRFNV